jgi:YYY domain-containing protein
MLLLGYAVWLPVSARLWQYDRWGLLTGVVLVVALNGLLLWRSGLGPLRAHLRAHRRQILQVEALFLGAFGFMVGVRALNPDLWQPIWGGEKPFEFGFLNAMLRTPVMPPYNPFYSDGVINYYYYGFFLVSLPLKATGIEPAVGFNLIVATLFALLLAGAFALVARAGGWRLGLLGAALVGVVSNLAGVVDASWLGRGGLAPALEALRGGLPGFGERLGDWFMGASRVVPYTINEFPYFSYLFADLHPHMIALPITILMVAIVWELFAGGARARGEGPMANDRMAPSYSRWSSVLGLWSLAALARAGGVCAGQSVRDRRRGAEWHGAGWRGTAAVPAVLPGLPGPGHRTRHGDERDQRERLPAAVRPVSGGAVTGGLRRGVAAAARPRAARASR